MLRRVLLLTLAALLVSARGHAHGDRRIPLQRFTLALDQRPRARAGGRWRRPRRSRDGCLRVRQRGAWGADVLHPAAARGRRGLSAHGHELRLDLARKLVAREPVKDHVSLDYL